MSLFFVHASSYASAQLVEVKFLPRFATISCKRGCDISHVHSPTPLITTPPFPPAGEVSYPLNDEPEVENTRVVKIYYSFIVHRFFIIPTCSISMTQNNPLGITAPFFRTFFSMLIGK